MENIKRVLEKMGSFEKWLVVVLVVGAIVSLVAIFRGILVTRSTQVEFIKAGESSETAPGDLIVDIEGAVRLPGVYSLPFGSRIKDVLVLSGGFSLKADREYIQKTLNLAQPLKDGQKIYVPFLSDTQTEQGYSEAKNGIGLININTASTSELDTLWGIGVVRVDNIVKNRPYESLEQLVEKKVFTKQILEKNRDKITVF